MSRRPAPTTLDLLGELLFILPWWAGPPVAGAAYLVLRFAAGNLARSSDLGPQLFGAFLAGLAPFGAAIVLIVWILAISRKLHRRFLLATRTGLASILSLPWRDFELLVGEAYRRDGYSVEERGGTGPDGGVDLVARRAGETLLIQCKRWKKWDVGVKVVREMYGVLVAERATGAVIVTSGRFTRAAEDFAAGKPIRLVDGRTLATLVAPAVDSRPLTPPPQDGTAGTPMPPPTQESEPGPTPACPKCGSPMVLRTARKGANVGQQFLGCAAFPRCRGTRQLPMLT